MNLQSMKIKKIYFRSLDMELSEPYTIAYETFSSCTNVFLMAETDSGLKGWGCGAPDAGVTGETVADTLRVVEEYIEPLLINADPFDFTKIMEELRNLLPTNPSALAMTDMLLYDLVSKKAGVPLYKYLGAYRHSIPTSITIGIMPVKDTLEKARAYYNAGFRIFKIKGGLSSNEDIEKVARIREEFGKNTGIRVDANQGYSVEQAIEFVEKTRKYNVEVLEQPTPRDDYEMLGKVSNKVSIPVMADESIMNLKDVFRLTRNDLTDMINIKLMKSGGISEAMHINSVARAAKVEVMVGCMDESEISIAAGLHFALSRPNIIYADLDGHLDLVNDPAKNSIILKKGVLFPSGRPGLGLNESGLLKVLFN
jgi:o-succinylbenzoate synthase